MDNGGDKLGGGGGKVGGGGVMGGGSAGNGGSDGVAGVMGLGKDPRGLCEGETKAPGKYISANHPGESGLTRGTHL